MAVSVCQLEIVTHKVVMSHKELSISLHGRILAERKRERERQRERERERRR